MNAPSVFRGSYANIVTRKTRSVCVVEVELPIEQMAAFIAAFGAPLPGVEIPVALARIDPNAKTAPEPRKPSSEPETKERRKYGDMPPATQAGMRCSDPDFRRFLGQQDRHGQEPADAESAAIIVRQICGVESRSDIVNGAPSARMWRDLDRAFLDWKHEAPLEGVARR